MEDERGSWRDEIGLGLEVTALTAFVIARPVLDSFGKSPETFVARQATTADIVIFGLLVAFAPGLVVAAVGGLTRLLGPAVRTRVHIALITLLGGLAAWRFVRDLTGDPGSATKVLVAAAVVGPLLGLLRHEVPSSATFLRYAGLASLIFLVQFLALSPVASLAFDRRGGVDDDVAAGVRDDLDTRFGDDAPPPVVMVVMDAFPTATLLDGSGHIDAAAFPNLAALADSSTWYRNSTSVAGFTTEAVPAIFTGRFPAANGSSVVTGGAPDNLFTLLGGSYDMHVREQLTALCPPGLCDTGARGRGDLAGLLGDAESLWWDGTADQADSMEMNLPGVTDVDRYGEFEDWIDQQDLSPDGGDGGRPDLFAAHLLLPHNPWDTLPDGTRYDASLVETGAFAGVWSDSGMAVGRQRHVLQAQAADRLIGHLTDRLRDAGIYDDALIVVTADHGIAFDAQQPERGVSQEQFEQILWAPLIVKAPGRTDGDGVVDDTNVMSVDILPTIADLLGVDIPWKVDGIAAGEVADSDKRDPAVKWFDDDPANRLRPDDESGRTAVDAEAGFRRLLTLDGVPDSGTDDAGAEAIWKRTPFGDLTGQAVADLAPATIGDDAPAGDALRLVGPPTRLDDIDLDGRLPLEVVGETALPVGTVVAYALNGTIAAVTTVEPPFQQIDTFAHGLLRPDLFVDGDNELTAYVVEGTPAAPVLHPLAVD